MATAQIDQKMAELWLHS